MPKFMSLSIPLRCIRAELGLTVASRSGKRRWYSLRIVRSVGLVFGFTKRHDNMLNPARWTAQGYASGCRLASTLGAQMGKTMWNLRNYLYVAAMLVCCVSVHAAPVQYSASEPVYGNDSPLGNLEVCVSIDKGSPVRVSFSVSMPDSGQLLDATVVATRDAQGVLSFDFEDGWENRGHGTFRVRENVGVLDLSVVRESSNAASRNILRNYGRFEVKRKRC
jgi:hypothetical protein